MARSRSKPPAPHAMPIILSLATIGLLGLALMQESERTAPAASQEQPAAQQLTDIGIEHRGSNAVQLTYTTDATPGFLEVSHEGDEMVSINLPASWKLRAVRLARIEDVERDEPKEGYIRWRLPPRAVLSMVLPASPAGMRVFNISSSPLELRVKRIVLQSDTATTDLFLLGKDEPFIVPH